MIMKQVFLLNELLPVELRTIGFEDTHWRYSFKSDSFFVKKDDIIVELDNSYRSAHFSLKASGDFIILVNKSRSINLGDIFYTLYSLDEVDSLSPHSYSVFTDVFTKEKRFEWSFVNFSSKEYYLDAGRLGSYVFVFKYYEAKPFLTIRYTPCWIKLKAKDTVSLLFDDQTVLSYTIKSPIRTLNTYRHDKEFDIELSENDLRIMSSRDLLKIKFDFTDGAPSFIFDNIPTRMNLIIGRVFFRKYAESFTQALNDCGFIWPDLSTPQETRNDYIPSDPCFVYLMIDTSNHFHKIGISNNPEYREGTLQSEKPTIELICAKQYPSRLIASSIESALHKAFDKKHLRGEWFKLDEKDVNEIILALK